MDLKPDVKENKKVFLNNLPIKGQTDKEVKKRAGEVEE